MHPDEYSACLMPSELCIHAIHVNDHPHTLRTEFCTLSWDDCPESRHPANHPHTFEAVEAPVTASDNKVEELVTELLAAVQMLTSELVEVRTDLLNLRSETAQVHNAINDALKPVSGSHKSLPTCPTSCMRTNHRGIEHEEWIARTREVRPIW